MGNGVLCVGMDYRYMDSASQQPVRVATGILTASERAFLRGENEVEQPDAYRSNIRYRVRQRMAQIEDDLALLREAGEGDVADEFLRRFDRVGQLEQEIGRLREQVEEQDG